METSEVPPDQIIGIDHSQAIDFPNGDQGRTLFQNAKDPDITILIGGTNRPPNARLPVYALPAVELARASGRNDIRLILSSTEAGGIAINYPNEAETVKKFTDQKLHFMKAFLEEFFPEAFAAIDLYRQPEHLVDKTVWKELWSILQEEYPKETEMYLAAAQGFTSKDQNPALAGIYGARHAPWALDFNLEGDAAAANLVNGGAHFSLGGPKESYFNLVRALVIRLGPTEISRILGRQVEAREQIHRLIVPFKTPVPYGAATYETGGKGNRVRHIAEVNMNDLNAHDPFAIKGPGRMDPLREEMGQLRTMIARIKNLCEDEAAHRYQQFWNTFRTQENIIL